VARNTMLRLVALATGAVVLVGCGSLLPQPNPQPGAGISVANNTTLDVTILLNGSAIGRVRAGDAAEIPPGELPPLPWSVEARSPSDRLLVSMTVRPGDVDQEGNERRGTGGRVDLSCGRLDIWSGPPMLGPAPGEGVPGDCVP
jgi:uncharacterized protein YceK